MKILVVLPDNSLGGVTTSAENFCRESFLRGNDVDLVVMNGGKISVKGTHNISITGFAGYWDLSLNTLKQSGIKFPVLFILGLVKSFLNKRGKWIPFIFRKYLLQTEYDVAIAYRQFNPCYYFTLHCVKARNKFAMIHGNLQHMPTTKSWDYLLKEFDKNICVSKAVSKGFADGFPEIAEKFTTVYNMFDAASIISRSKDSCQYYVDKETVNIISVTRHDNWQKNTDRIPQACAVLKQRGVTNFHWYIAGDGPHMENNIQLAQELGVYDMITFCGAMSNPFALQAQCDFSVLTSSTEAYSMSVIESQILKKPIVAMRYDGIEEAIEDGKAGLIAEQNVESLCDALERMIKDESLRDSMHQYLVDTPYSNERAYNQFLNLIK